MWSVHLINYSSRNCVIWEYADQNTNILELFLHYLKIVTVVGYFIIKIKSNLKCIKINSKEVGGERESKLDELVHL